MSPGRRVLLVSPVFHDYWRSIARGLEDNGLHVAVHCYDEHVGVVAKARNKLLYEGLDRLRPGAGTARFERAATEGARAALRRERPEVVVVVKGDLLTEAFWDDVARSGAAQVLWLYDELRRTRHDPARLVDLGPVASYSADDVAALRAAGGVARHVPLAFDPFYGDVRIPSRDVVFIGARYPGREALLTEAAAAGVPIRAVGNDWSHRRVDRLRTWSWDRPDLPASPSVSRLVGSGLMAGALATVNIHGDQDGFTMRTFEAAGVGALQLIDRADVEVHYEPGTEVLTFASVPELVDLVDRATREPRWAARIRAAGRRRTLAEHTFAHRARDLEELWD